jgi:hypothetical protein
MEQQDQAEPAPPQASPTAPIRLSLNLLPEERLTAEELETVEKVTPI